MYCAHGRRSVLKCGGTGEGMGGVSPSRRSKFFLNKHVKEALIEHPRPEMMVWRILRPAVMVQYVGDRLKLLNDWRSTRAGEGMVSPSHRSIFFNRHVKEAVIEHSTTQGRRSFLKQ